MKKLSNLNGAKALSKNEQKSINGGYVIYTNGCDNCPGTCHITVGGTEVCFNYPH